MLINKIIDSKESYSKRNIKAAEQAREMYAYLEYPSVKEYKLVIQSNQIKDFTVTVHDIDVDHKIWDKSVPDLKEKPLGRNQYLWQATCYRCWKSWRSYINKSI